MDDRTHHAHSGEDLSRPRTIREAVKGEDPAAWGPRDQIGTHDPSLAHSTTTPSHTTTAPVARTTSRDDVAGVPAYERRDTVTTTDTHPEALPRGVRTEPPVERRRFSIGATFLGWAVAAFFTLVFSAIVAGLVGGTAVNTGADDVGDAQNLGIGSLIGYLVATFLAFLIGGYAAGRIALWDGLKHGLGIVAWSVLFAILAVVAGTALADYFNVEQFALPVDLSNLTGYAILGIVLTLLAQLLGAALGGRLGERYHDRVHGIDTRERRRTLRGRRAL